MSKIFSSFVLIIFFLSISHNLAITNIFLLFIRFNFINPNYCLVRIPAELKACLSMGFGFTKEPLLIFIFLDVFIDNLSSCV